MKKSLVSLVLCSVILVGLTGLVGCEPTEPPTEPPKEKMSVILLSGQSNMEGNSWSIYLEDDEHYDAYLDGFSDITMALRGEYQNATFLPVRLGRGGVSFSQFGPEIGMARMLHDAGYGNKVCFIKYAVGGTNFYSKDRENWSSPADGEPGVLYTRFVTFVLEALEKLSKTYDVSLDAMCWMQGESDCFIPAADDYEYNLRNFVDYLRLEFSDYNEYFMFYDAYISQYWGNGRDYKDINQAKANLAAEDPYHKIIDTIAAGLTYNNEPIGNIDPAHYDALSEIKLGELFAAMYMADFPITK